MEVKKEIKKYVVDYKCPECEDGLLRPTNKTLLSKPPKYPHRCTNPNCSYKMTFKNKYPYEETELICK